MRISQVTLDGEPVTQRVLRFDQAGGTVDVLARGPDGKPVVVDGRPQVSRLTGKVGVVWDPAEVLALQNAIAASHASSE